MKKPSQFDAIVVGAGPSGNAAAYTLAKAGLKVLQIERGEYPGSKNVQGAILYADALEKIIPDFRDEAPLERHIIEQRMWVLDDNSFVGTHYRSDDYNKPPYNRYTIIRAQFDKWFSSKVREAGALVICETTVNHLIMDGDQVVGVQCDREAGDVYADVVILADGVNSTLARKAGFHGEIKASNVALAVKEILFLPEDTIRQRFNIGEEEGVVIEMLGKITDGMMGTGFLYTNKESLTIGVGCMLGDFKANPNKTSPYALLEQMKRHPSIAPLIEGGEMKEYTAHLIPEGGLKAVPQIYGDGWVIVRSPETAAVERALTDIISNVLTSTYFVVHGIFTVEQWDHLFYFLVDFRNLLFKSGIFIVISTMVCLTLPGISFLLGSRRAHREDEMRRQYDAI